MRRPRTAPYTEIGIRRVRCTMKGCRRKGYASWQVCADGRVYRVLCWFHDIELNKLVLRWVGDRAGTRKLDAYELAVRQKAGVA